MNGTVKITGGKPLRGEVIPIPNKNALVAVIPACILSDENSALLKVPHTSDVEKLMKIVRLLGGSVKDEDYQEIMLGGRGVEKYQIDKELGGQFRASFMMVGPLLARFGWAEVPLPGGCLLGERSVAVHVDAFERMGVGVSYENGFVRFVAPKQTKDHYRVWQLEASVTATENLAMYAAGIEAETEIIDAACEPHVVDLLNFLASMGASIEGIGTNRVIIKGSKKLTGGRFEPRPDFVDIAGYMTAAAITKGEILIKGANIPDIVDGLINWFSAFNLDIDRGGEDLRVKYVGELGVDLNRTNFPTAAKNLPKLTPRPWPGFPVDVIPVMVTLASKANGRLVIQNWMYESGLDFVREMNGLGADIFMADPQRVIVQGPVNFRGGEVVSPAVIQACKAIFLAALADPVETTIHGMDILRRRYPDIIETYQSLGAEIEAVEKR